MQAHAESGGKGVLEGDSCVLALRFYTNPRICSLKECRSEGVNLPCKLEGVAGPEKSGREPGEFVLLEGDHVPGKALAHEDVQNWGGGAWLERPTQACPLVHCAWLVCHRNWTWQDIGGRRGLA